jgi:hypothetical protein
VAGQETDHGLLAFVVSTTTGALAWLRRLGPAVQTTLDRAAKAERLLADLKRRRDDLEAQDRALQARAATAQVEVETAKKNLDEVRFDSLIRRHIRKRVAEATYHEQLGLISLIRQDLESLSDLLAPSHEADDADPRRRSDIDRIVLYIDDLDRCPPERVVEVLQAVHLLLAFPLFVVVVGVDSRWLLTSLQRHYRHLLEAGEEPGRLQEWEATPSDYLEKIFQLPLALSPMTDAGYRRLVADMVPIAQPLATTARPMTPGTPPDQGSGGGSAEPPRDGPPPEAVPKEDKAPVRPDVVRTFELTGEALALWFTSDGRRLLVATTTGFWGRHRGTDSLRQLWQGPISSVSLSVDGTRAAWVSTGGVHVADFAVGDSVTTFPSDREVTGLAVRSRPGEVLVGYRNGDIELLSPRQEVKHTTTSIPGACGVLTEGPNQELLFALDDKATLHALRLPKLEKVYQVADVDAFAITAEDVGLVTTTGRTLRRHEVASGKVAWAADLAGAEPPLRLSGRGIGSGLYDQRGIPYRWDGPREVPVALDVPGPRTEWSLEPKADLYVGWNAHAVSVIGQRNPRLRYALDGVPVERAAVSPSGALLATVGNGTCSLWRLSAASITEAPSQLELSEEEFEFLAGLGPLVPTARAAKRLVNIYRLIRASRSGRRRLHDPGTEDYRIVLVLLALVVGWPRLADVVLTNLGNGSARTWPAFLEEVQATVRDGRFVEHSGHRAGRVESDADQALRHVRRLSANAPSELKRYAEWGWEVERFLVTTRADPSGHESGNGRRVALSRDPRGRDNVT